MLPIRIQCGCGQEYEFEVEPVDGQMPSTVACPACGADGTAVANEVIAQTASAAPAAPAARLRIAVPSHSTGSAASAPARRSAMKLPGQVDRVQAEHEAKAKISWGDPPQQVAAYLMGQGFTREEAVAFVDDLFRERAATIRGNGIVKIVLGVAAICLPVVTLVYFLWIGVIYAKILALTVMAGLWGLWTASKGIFMVMRPKAEPGDVAEQ